MTSQDSTEHKQTYTEHRRHAARKIGFLGGADKDAWEKFLKAFNDQLTLLGLQDRVDFQIVDKYADGKKSKYASFAHELTGDQDIQIIVTAGTQPLQAVIDARGKRPIWIVVASAGYTGTIPDKVSGFRNGQAMFATNRFDKFVAALPDNRLSKMAVMANVDAPSAVDEQEAVMNAIAAKPVERVRVPIKLTGAGDTEADGSDAIATAIRGLAREVKSLYVCTDPLLTKHQKLINHWATNSKQLPTMFQFKEHVETGGLMSYGPDFQEMFRKAATLVARFLNNKLPLPALAEPDSDQFKLVWNRTTAGNLHIPDPTNFTGELIN